MENVKILLVRNAQYNIFPQKVENCSFPTLYFQLQTVVLICVIIWTFGSVDELHKRSSGRWRHLRDI